jgi:hypothetical protein
VEAAAVVEREPDGRRTNPSRTISTPEIAAFTGHTGAITTAARRFSGLRT